MPTGYTYDVGSGKISTLREFGLTCARAFGALTEERDALIRDKEEAQSLLEWPFASVRELANETGRLRMNEHALTEERDEAVKRVEVKDALLADEFKHSAALAERVSQAEARAAAMEAALRQIIKLYDPTSDDDFEAVQMVEIARAALAPQAEAGEPG